ncbi:MAG TPA: histidinol dehydrogenase, partial [Pseudonocardiaceae bacterium]|nr:histidinol dehydrogenase [Pseudonocardiaceae bacterium]
MLRRTDLRGRHLSTARLRALLPRAEVDVDAVTALVRPVLDAVRQRGVPAAREFSQRFDGVAPDPVRVPEHRLAEALDALDPVVRAALTEATGRARLVHRDQRRAEVRTEVTPGGTVTQRWVPVERVGLYVPGGNAAYPSSVVMNVVPAQVAGVGSMVVCSPPQAGHGGLPHPTVLAACALLRVTEVWAVG